MYKILFLSIVILVGIGCKNNVASDGKAVTYNTKSSLQKNENSVSKDNVISEVDKTDKVLYQNPMETDKDKLSIDLTKIPQPKVKSAGQSKPEVKIEEPKEPKKEVVDKVVVNKETSNPISSTNKPEIITTKPTTNSTATTPTSSTTEKPVDPKVTIPETPKAEPTKPTPPKKASLSHSAWNTLLSKHVSSTGKVNYKGFKSDNLAFEAYLKLLADNPLEDSWSRNKKMAYWINAYNAFTVKLILDNYPLSSITNLDGGKPWDKKWIKLGGKTYSLNNIENDILRPQYKDARIHFAVNCAAKSCPPLLNKAWTASNLESNLEKQAKSFINDSAQNMVSKKEIKVSKIFEWYAQDFGNLINYINKYSSAKANDNAKISYQEYNWNLNE